MFPQSSSLSDAVLPNIAIDGPAGAGKTTIARAIARELNYRHIDSGAMYRAVTLLALNHDLKQEIHNEEQIHPLASELDIEFAINPQGEMRVLVQGCDCTEALRTSEIDRHVSVIASMAKVREELVSKQQELAEDGGVVMDGRDIGTHVLKNAQVKVFLTAAIPVRVHRRLRQHRCNGVHLTWQQAAESVIKRDRIDSTRKISPLKASDDAIIIESTHLTVEDVVSQVRFILQSRMNCADRE